MKKRDDDSGQTRTQFYDEGDLRKYRIELPNLIDDMNLSVYAFRLYVHIKRVAGASQEGECFQGTRTLATHCGMSVSKVSEAKRELLDAHLITLERRDNNQSDLITVKDIWPENFARYAKDNAEGCSPHEHSVRHTNTGVPTANAGVRHANERKNPIKNKPLKKESRARAPQPLPDVVEEPEPPDEAEPSRDVRETKALVDRLHHVGSPATPLIVDTYMELAKEIGLENVLRGLTAAAEQGKQYNVKYVTACARNAQRGDSGNRNGASNGTHRRSNGFGRDAEVRDPEPEFIPDAEFLAGMERFNAIRAGRAPAGT